MQACKTPEQKNEWNIRLRNLVGTKLLVEFQQQAHQVRNNARALSSSSFFSSFCGPHLPFFFFYFFDILIDLSMWMLVPLQ